MPQAVIGCDLSRAVIDICELPSGRIGQIANTSDAIAVCLDTLDQPSGNGAPLRGSLRSHLRMRAVRACDTVPHPEVLAEGEPRRTHPCARFEGRLTPATSA